MQIALPCCFKIEFGAQAKIQLTMQYVYVIDYQ